MDSPALNAHSRAVLVSLPRMQLPGAPAIHVAGPGPAEPVVQSIPPSPLVKPSLAVPPVARGADSPSVESDEVAEDADADDEPRGAGDPYSDLDGAFGNYLADQPRPITAGNRAHGDEDDLLF